MKQELTKEQAITILLQTARVAQSRGAFTLEEAEVVAPAVKLLSPVEAVTEEVK